MFELSVEICCCLVAWLHLLLLCPWDFPGKNTGVGCHFLLQGTFLTQGSNLHLLNWQVSSLPLSQLGSIYGGSREKWELWVWNSEIWAGDEDLWAILPENMVLSVTLEVISNGRSMTIFRKTNMTVICRMEENEWLSVLTHQKWDEMTCVLLMVQEAFGCSVSVVEESRRATDVDWLKGSLEHRCWPPW